MYEWKWGEWKRVPPFSLSSPHTVSTTLDSVLYFTLHLCVPLHQFWILDKYNSSSQLWSNREVLLLRPQNPPGLEFEELFWVSLIGTFKKKVYSTTNQSLREACQQMSLFTPTKSDGRFSLSVDALVNLGMITETTSLFWSLQNDCCNPSCGPLYGTGGN